MRSTRRRTAARRRNRWKSWTSPSSSSGPSEASRRTPPDRPMQLDRLDYTGRQFGRKKGQGRMAEASVTAANEKQRQAWLSGAMPGVERVRPGLWSIPVPIPINPLRYVLVYAFEVPGGVVIVDAGWNTEEAFGALDSGLNVAGYRIADVKAVLVTHLHPDHYGLAGRVREASGAWGVLPPADARLLHERYDDEAMNVLIERQRELLA